MELSKYEPSAVPPPPASSVPLATFLPPLPVSGNLKQRADLLSLKGRLAALLPPDAGLEYWTALVDFISGRINRQELGIVMKRVLGVKGEAVQLHNALLLSILYNTTRTAVPPAAVRHAGWNKRPRDKDGLSLEDRDPKRRKLKATVMAIGKRERAELKTLGLGKRDVEPDAAGELAPTSLRATMDSSTGKVHNDGLPLALVNANGSATALQEEYMRCLQTPLCFESKLLPDVNTLKDRMSLVAYQSGLPGGADARVAALGVEAIESHLRSLISSVISLVRTDRANGVQTTGHALRQHLALASDPATKSSDRPDITLSNGNTTVALPDDTAQIPAPRLPLSLPDFCSLFEIAPHLLVQPHVGSVERMYAIPPPSDSEDSDPSASEEEEEDVPTPRAVSGKTSLRTVSRSGSRSGKSASRSASISVNANGSSNVSNGGRGQYLIDPSAVALPLGNHPDVAHPRLASLSLPTPTTSASYSVPNGQQGVSTRGTSISSVPVLSRATSNGHSLPSGSQHPGNASPKSVSLRNQLFPELEADGVVDSPAPLPQSPSIETTTDAASDSDDGGKGKGKLGAGPKKQGRNLWEVVDSVSLLAGVLN